MNDMFLLKNDGLGQIYVRSAALGAVRIIPMNLRGTGGFRGDVELTYLSGSRDYITEADWERIKPFCLAGLGKDWQTEALRLQNELDRANEENEQLRRRIGEVGEANDTLRQQLTQKQARATALAMARAAVKDEETWYEQANTSPQHIGEADEALTSYHDKAQTFFELYDESLNQPIPVSTVRDWWYFDEQKVPRCRNCNSETIYCLCGVRTATGKYPLKPITMSEDQFEKALRADMAEIMTQPADTPPPPRLPEPLKPDADLAPLVNIIRVERGSFKSKTAGRMCPMWRMFTDDGRQVNAFDHTDPLRDHKPLLTQAGYMDLFKAMSEGDIQSWTNTPIKANISDDGMFWKLISLAKIGELDAPDFEAESDESDDLTSEQQEAAQDARRLLNDKSMVVIDTETTGLNKGIDQPIELAIIDAEGTVLFHKRIKPTVAVTDGAAAIHHITDEMLANEPTFDDLADEIGLALEGKRVLAYNVEFDLAMLRNVGIEVVYSHCIADLYNTFAGETYPSGKIKKHKLIDACAKMELVTSDMSGEHTALGDAQRALHLLKAMALHATVDDTADEEIVPPTAGAVKRDVDEIPF